jgi:uncharacterized repeat protein (TIGR01451 family)
MIGSPIRNSLRQSLHTFGLIVVALAAMLQVQVATAATAGPNNAGTAGNTTWLTPADATGAANDTCATGFDPIPPVTGGPIDLTNFSFSLPAGSIISGILVEPKAAQDGTTSWSAQLLKAGAPVGTAKTFVPTANAACSGTTFASLGGVADPWGTTWTPDDINAANFGVRLTWTISSAVGFLDAVRITIFFSQTPPTLSKAFGAPSIPLGGSTTLTFTIQNPNPTIGLTGIQFTDTLPAGLVVSTPSGLSGTCSGTITAPSGTTTISMVGGSLAGGASCTFTVNSVTGIAAGTQNNITGAILSPQTGAGGTASASLEVLPPSPPSTVKAFGAASILLNGSTSLTITITNPNASLPLNGVAFTDTLPAGLVVASNPNLNSTCSGITTAGLGSVSLTGGTLAAGGTCTVSANVTGTSAGIKNNSVQVTSTDGAGNTANASLTVVGPPTISKAFGAPSVPLNGSTSLSFTLTNPNATVALTGVAFTDSLPSGLLVATPNGLTGSCGGGTITATEGSGTITLSGAVLAGGASCTFAVNVTGLAAGTLSNTTGAVSSTDGGTGTTSNTATLNVVAPPIISKAFGETSIDFNGTTSLTFTITNPAVNTVPLTGIGFADTFPLGVSQIVVASPNGLTGSCGGGTITAISGDSSVTLGGATLAVGESCTFSVDVVPVSSGGIVNTVTVASANGGSGNTATARLAIAPRLIPTLQGWALVLLGLLLAGAGWAMLRRRNV